MGKLDRYYEIRDKIAIGDCLLFGNNEFIGKVIKGITNSKYSHIGMALTLDVGITGANISQERVFIVESTTLNNVPDISGEFRKGVQMIAMSQRLDSYNGSAWWLPLSVPIQDDKQQEMVQWLLAKEASRTDYDEVEAVQAVLDDERWIWPFRWLAKPFSSLFRAKPDYNKLFCSEMVTRALQIAGKVPESIDPSEQSPQDVTMFPIFKDPIQIL